MGAMTGPEIAPDHPAWLTLFIDVPAAAWEESATFWTAVTGTRLSARRGEHGEFATLLPPAGDACLRHQGLAAGPAGVHLDLHAADAEGLADRAVGLGATRSHDEPGFHVLRSPAGLAFCAVAHDGERELPPPTPVPGGGSTRVDQACLDLPADRYDDELAFWTRLTGWTPRRSARPEFARLRSDGGRRLNQLLVQRLDDPPPTGAAAVHLDLAAGPPSDLDAARDWHIGLGAVPVTRFERWQVMRAPGGLVYCLTGRDPVTGELSA